MAKSKSSTKSSRRDNGSNVSSDSEPINGDDPTDVDLPPVKPQKAMFLVALTLFVIWLLYLVYVAIKVAGS